MIRVTCPSCGKKLNAPDEAAGKKGKCPCGERIWIPCTIGGPIPANASSLPSPVPAHVNPSSSILFVTICSLNKASGGVAEYDEAQSVTSALPAISNAFLQRREDVRRLVLRTKNAGPQLDWQGIPLVDLDFNKALKRGPDFGGNESAEFLPAMDRFAGRLFQTLGDDGKSLLCCSKHHTLFLCGLYGLIRPMECVQLYSCPLKPEVAVLWSEGDLLTRVVLQYIRHNGITHAFDLTAMEAYRNMIDWSALTSAGVNVLHCFDTMSVGDYSLVPFGRLLKTKLLDMKESDLQTLPAETKIDTILFRSDDSTRPGLPYEEQVRSAEEEIPHLQSHTVASAADVIQYGSSSTSVPETASSSKGGDWRFAVGSQFRKAYSQDKKLASGILKAILDICKDPMKPHGDTKKPLSGNFKGKWRYRIGNHRLIYQPRQDNRTVYLLVIDTRGDCY